MGRDAPGKGDYVWGEQVAMIEFVEKKVQGLETLAQVQPGDIIQFRDMQLKGDVVTAKGRGWYSLSAPHHTAVVNSVDAAKNTLAIFHQNWSGNKTVRQDTLKLSDLVSGWLRIYRPKPLP